MFKKTNTKTNKSSLSQFGLLDIPGSIDDFSDGSDADLDLEAELAAISGGNANARKKHGKPVVPAPNLDHMVAESLKDIPSDDEVSDGEDDPDLLSELKELTVEDNESPPEPPPRMMRAAPPPPTSAQSSLVSLLKERIEMYVQAESNAKSNGESSRARRFGRGLKTLQDLQKQVALGRQINEDDIPPVVSVGKKVTDPAPENQLPDPLVPTPAVPLAPTAPEVQPEPTPVPDESPSAPEPEAAASTEPTMTADRQQGLQMILKRQLEFKAAALASKHAGDKVLALEYLKVAKQFDIVVDAYRSGQEMDLAELPTVDVITAAFRSEKTEEQTQQSTPEPGPSPAQESGKLITASSVEEALRQHLSVYKEQEAKAMEQGNSFKQRRMGRIVKQFKQAIKLHAAGKPIPTEDLPTPLGYAPIPVAGASSAQTPTRPSPVPSRSAAPPPPPKPNTQASRTEKQVAFLLQKQQEFKVAALTAKKNGDISQAKEYLRSAKGFDPLIDSARGGLLIDMKSLPLPPQTKQHLEDTFDVVSADDCGPMPEDSQDVLATLQKQLTSQLKLCLTNRDHYKAMGNVAETNRFENLAVTVKQDLDLITIAKRLGKAPPKFHFEPRQFSVVQCNTDLNENDLELSIVRGISYNVPNPREVDTYVKFEFPYPQEAPVSDRTAQVKDTNSPVYNAVFPLLINRLQRPCLRVFKRHGIKFEVFSKGCGSEWCCYSGWFYKDALLGTVNVKLAPLETHTVIHEAFPLMDGRRPAGGSLEIKLRVRTPLLQQQFENTTHRWLVIDN